MKKTMTRLFAALLAAICLMSFAACGKNPTTVTGSGPAQTPSSAAESEPVSEPESTPESTPESDAALGEGLTMEEFVGTEEFQTIIGDAESGTDESGVDLEITGEGNVLVMTYTIKDLTGVVPDDFGEQLKSSMSEAGSVFRPLASMFESVGIEDPVVRVVYTDASGNELYSEDFTPEE